MHADSTPPGVFEFLDATHRRVDQHLKRLRLLVDRIAADGLDHAAQKEAREVLDFFNSEARQHHLDEEKHIFPALLASGDDKVVHAARSLTQDHGWLEENWLYIEPMVEAAADGNGWFDTTELASALDVFEALYNDHTSCWKSRWPTPRPANAWPRPTPAAWAAKWRPAAPG